MKEDLAYSSEEDWAYQSLAGIGALIQSRAVTSRQVTEALLQRIAQRDSGLRAFVLVMGTEALAQADRADREIAAGEVRGPLHGVPVAVKDLCWIKGFPCAGGTAVLSEFRPEEDASVVRFLREAGAILIGKTRLTEGAYSDYHSSIQPTLNPWNNDYWTGISSSGSAVAVASGFCFGSIATDTGGSIRWPSAANGITGIKPTWGLVSRFGVIELAASLDHIGVMARSVVDASIVLSAIAGGDARDPTASQLPRPDYVAAAMGADIQGLRIGVDPQWNTLDVDKETQDAVLAGTKAFAELGASIVEIEFPKADEVVKDWVPNCAVEAAVAHELLFARHKSLYGPVFSSVIEAGASLSGMDYQKILLRRAAFKEKVNALLASVDAVITPAHPFPPLTLKTISTLGAQPELISKLQRYTSPFNMSGHPTLSIPAGFARDGMPIGMQLIAAQFDESTLLRLGSAFQRVTSWHLQHPPTGGIR